MAANTQEPRPVATDAGLEAARAETSRHLEAIQREANRPVNVLPPRRERRWLNVLIFLIVVASIAYGWQISEVEPGKLIEKRADFSRIIGTVLRADFLAQDEQNFTAAFNSPNQPNNVAQTQQKISADLDGVLNFAQQMQADIKAGTFKTDDSDQIFRIQNMARQAADVQTISQGNTDENAIVTKPVAGKPQIVLNPPQGNPGARISVQGSNYAPNIDVSLNWIGGDQAEVPLIRVDPSAPISVRTDSKGSFTTAFTVPAVSTGRIFSNNRLMATASVVRLAPSKSLQDTWDKILVTVFQALLASILAIVVSVPLAFLAARNIMPHTAIGNAVYTVVRTILNIVRSIEVLIIAVVFAAAVGVGPFAGLLALIVHSIVSLAKLYSEAIEGIDPGPIEAIRTTGANPLQVARYAIIPQVIPAFISFTLYRWDVNVRMATIVGLVGGGGVGFLLNSYSGQLQWAQAGTVIWAIAIVVIMLDFASSRIRQAVV